MSNKQIRAERGHVLREIVGELGGLAHAQMSPDDLDSVIDNMLSKGVPHTLSDNLLRWIHVHRKDATYKIAQILGAHVDKTSSIIPECLGKFYDEQAVECKACLDGTVCSMKSRKRLSGQSDGADVKQLYQIGKKADADTINKVLSQKWGQISRTLAHGAKVVLEVGSGTLRVLSVSPENSNTSKEDITMAKTKKAPQVEEVEEEEDISLDLTAEDEEEVEEDGEELEEEADEEEEDEAPVAAPKAKKVVAPAAKAATATAVAEAPAKVKKEPKPKPVLNKAQQQFQDELDKRSGEEKQKYSAAIAKKLGVKVDEKGDARIDHMLRTMAIKKHLASK